MFLFLLLLPNLTRAEERSPPSIYMHTAAFQHRGTLWTADGVLHVRVPLELTFLEEECRSTKTLLRSAVVKTTGKWQQVVLQHANRTLHDACLEIWQWEHLLPRGGTRTDSTEATSRPRRSVTLAVLAATVFGRFLLPPLEELFTGKSITNSMEIERARFAALQQDVKHLHDNLNWEQDELDLLALAGVIKTQARHIADFNAALVTLVAHHRLAPPLLTPSVVQDVWKMYQEETGVTAFPFVQRWSTKPRPPTC